MNKTHLVLLSAALFCIGTASAANSGSIFCPPGATVNSTGPNSTPPLTGTAVCPLYTPPAGNVLTSVVLTVEGDMESPAGNGTFTYNFALSGFAPVTSMTEVITATGNTSGPFNWTAPGVCSTSTDIANCTLPASGTSFPAITVNASGVWTTPGSAGLLPNGAETFNVFVVYSFGPAPSGSCGVITGAVQGVPITPTAPLVGTGGSGTGYTFTATGLPSGLTMASNGSISGTPSVSGTFSYTVTVTDSVGNTGTFNCSVTVNPPPTAACAVFTGLVQNVAITPTAPLAGSGGTGGPYTFTATGLPNGLTMASNGVISGTPTVGGNFTYTVTVTDGAGHTGTVTCTLSIGGPPTTSCGVINNAVAGTPITPTAPLVGSGGTGGPYTFTATGLPTGLTMASNGSISGTPTVTGTFSYTVTVTDGTGHTGTVNCSVTVNPGAPPTANCASISAVVNVPITPITVMGSGGAGGPYTFTATGLPAGLTMASDGTISGTPTVSGTFPYTVTVTDVAGNVGTVNCSVTVLPTPPPPGSCFYVSYAANLGVGESYVNLINTGAAGAPLLGPGFGPAVGNICVNVYAFDPQEEEISCCSCLLTPNAVANLGVNRDLLGTTLTGVVPSSVVIKLVCTLAGGDGTGTSCSQNAAVQGFQTPSLVAYGTTVQPVGTKYSAVEHPFISSTLSPGEYASITGRCASIQGNGSGYGICNSCRAGALGATKQ